MSTVTPRYLVDENQMPTDVVLSLEQWESIVEQLEMLADIRAYDTAKAGPQDSVPLADLLDRPGNLLDGPGKES
jgi:hypothetical protein